jgi:hypothetical protein
MKATINSIQSELEQTIKNLVEDILTSINQQTKCLHEELHMKMEEKQVELKTSLDMWTRNLCKEVADTRTDLHRSSTLR